MKPVIIFGSSNSQGNTRLVADKVQSELACPLVDLNTKDISYFDYKHLNRDDDFIPLIDELLAFDLWVIATPVYWYTMSGVMKVFFDRFSDLLAIEKDRGRRLRGKSMTVLTTSSSDQLDTSFWRIFEQSAEYLGMHYLDGIHISMKDGPSQADLNPIAPWTKALYSVYQSLPVNMRISTDGTNK